MAYSISQPRKDLIAAVDEITQRAYSAAQVGVPSDVREYAFAASIFLSHAELENYFVDMIDRVARLYSNHSPSALPIPTRLRAHLFVLKSSLQAAFGAKISGGDEQSLLAAVERSFIGSAGSMINPAIALVPFTGAEILGDYSYPSIKNIERAMRRLGKVCKTPPTTVGGIHSET
ncbi:hypothetical protein J7U46_12335 [Pelomonas sp. V22]|uniref:hypothetical protein n=1 Tax=Pelomonas sp. V22 TaxID=2822139 RepID=UPI0024A8CD3C|nr:hypothetical protein [Pelomonas sp. V22]MDI4633838.1 hypothetical protein [Pelomonas sp. V22]